MTWIQTFTGRAFDFADPQPDLVAIEDIAHALANLCRFSGHVRSFYSVAQHSVYVSERCDPADAMWGLLHDATEAYVADLARPIKRLPDLEAYRTLEQRVMHAVAAHIGLEPEMPESVREADDRMLATETAQLMGEPPRPWQDPAEVYPDLRIAPFLPAEAEQLFSSRFRALGG